MSGRDASHDGRYRWMEALLLALFDRWDDQQARELLRNAASRPFALAELMPALIEDGADPALLASAAGENLVLAVLALRLKFPRDEALVKVRQNIVMREHRSR